MGREVRDRGFRREVLQGEDPEAVSRVEDVGGFGVGAAVGEEDREAGGAAAACASEVDWGGKEEEGVDSVAEFGGEGEEGDGWGGGKGEVVDCVVKEEAVGEGEVVEGDGKGFGEAVGPGGVAGHSCREEGLSGVVQVGMVLVLHRPRGAVGQLHQLCPGANQDIANMVRVKAGQGGGDRGGRR